MADLEIPKGVDIIGAINRFLPLAGIDIEIKAGVIGGWISARDRLPQSEVRVLTVDNLGKIRVLVQNEFEGLTDWYNEEYEGFEDSVDVTHWQPLPEPPK